MSRVGKNPVAVPAGVEVTLTDGAITVKGPMGTLTQRVNPLVSIAREGAQIMFPPADDSREANAMSGTYRAIVANMVHGVSKGFEKKLQLVGTGYRAVLTYWDLAGRERVTLGRRSRSNSQARKTTIRSAPSGPMP